MRGMMLFRSREIRFSAARTPGNVRPPMSLNWLAGISARGFARSWRAMCMSGLGPLKAPRTLRSQRLVVGPSSSPNADRGSGSAVRCAPVILVIQRPYRGLFRESRFGLRSAARQPEQAAASPGRWRRRRAVKAAQGGIEAERSGGALCGSTERCGTAGYHRRISWYGCRDGRYVGFDAVTWCG